MRAWNSSFHFLPQKSSSCITGPARFGWPNNLKRPKACVHISPEKQQQSLSRPVVAGQTRGQKRKNPPAHRLALPPPSPAPPPPWTRITSSAASPAPATRLRHRSSHLTPPTRTPTGTRRRRHRTLPTPATPTLRNTTTIGGRLPTSSNSPSVILRRCNSSSTGINSLPRRLRYSSSSSRLLLLGTPGLLTTPPASPRRLATLLRPRGRYVGLSSARFKWLAMHWRPYWSNG